MIAARTGTGKVLLASGFVESRDTCSVRGGGQGVRTALAVARAVVRESIHGSVFPSQPDDANE